MNVQEWTLPNECVQNGESDAGEIPFLNNRWSPVDTYLTEIDSAPQSILVFHIVPVAI